jgi:DNA polymerase-3 subunit delta
MTDVKAHQADRFVRSPPRDLTAALFYGTDPGVVAERAGHLAATIVRLSKEPSDILRVDESDLAADPDRLAIELRTIPMFGGRKIVRLALATLNRAELAIELLTGEPLAGFLIVEAGNLKPDAKLRRAFADAANAAAIACYPDDAQSLGPLVDEVLEPYRIEIDADARTDLIGRLGADRALSRMEIEKLALYAGAGGRIALTDVEAVVGDAAEQALDQVVGAVCSGDAAAALAQFDRSIDAGESPQTVLILLQRHLIRLQQMSASVAAGKSADQLVRSARPPLPFRQQQAVAGQLRLWDVERLGRAIGTIHEATAASRLTSILERQIVERALLAVAGRARRGGGQG